MFNACDCYAVAATRWLCCLCGCVTTGVRVNCCRAGYLVLRTAAITFTYAIATGLTARAGPAAAACHQVTDGCGCGQHAIPDS
jgi:hypothetical protein